MSARIAVDLGPEQRGGGDVAAREAGKVCERCDFAAFNVGPFRNDATGERWARLCARCKVQITLTPDTVASMERELSAAVRALNGDHDGEG